MKYRQTANSPAEQPPHWDTYQHRCTRRTRKAVVNTPHQYHALLTQCNSSQPRAWSKPFSTLYSSASPINLKKEQNQTNPDKKTWRHESNADFFTELLNNFYIGFSDVIQSSAKPGLL